MSDTETGWKIKVEAEAPTRELAIQVFEKYLQELRSIDFKESHSGGFSYLGTEQKVFTTFCRSVTPPMQKVLRDWELREIRAALLAKNQE
jgi:hypothetical protein